jgi:hypothetical protein
MNCRPTFMSAFFGLSIFAAAFTPNSAFAADADGDGVDSSTDCNDADASVKGPTDRFYQDADEDGFGNPGVSMLACVQPADYVSDNGDCNDSESSIFSGAPEVVGDGIDQDCAGGDLVLPVTEQVFARFVAAEYGGVLTTAENFVHEYGACNAAAECTVDMVNARFVITDSDYVFQDLKDNRTGVLHCGKDGREVVTAVAWSHAPRCSSRSGGGIGKSTVIRLAEETVTAALATYDEGIQAQFAEVTAQQAALERRVDGIERMAAENQGNIASNREDIARNTAAIGGLQTWKAGVDQTNARQDREIQTALSQGMSLWLAPSVRYLSVPSITGELEGEEIRFRKSAHTFTGVAARVGYTIPEATFFLTGSYERGGDSIGKVPDSFWQLGAGAVWHVQGPAQGLQVGGNVTSGILTSSVNALEYSARDSVTLVEGEVGYDFARSSIFDATLTLFAGIGGSSYGVYGIEGGEESVFDGGGMAKTVGARFYIGASPSEARID